MSTEHLLAPALEPAEKLLQAADERRSTPISYLFPIRVYRRSSAAIDSDRLPPHRAAQNNFPLPCCIPPKKDAS
jgi:hypothetical protein